MDSLRREVKEEAGAVFSEAIPFATLRFPPRQDLMLFFLTSDFELGSFVPGSDVLDRAVVSVDLLLARYHGDVDMLRQLIELAQSRRWN